MVLLAYIRFMAKLNGNRFFRRAGKPIVAKYKQLLLDKKAIP